MWTDGPYRRQQEGGFSLLEVLVGVVVLSVGLLGMAGLQMNAMKNNQSSFERTQAVVLGYFILDAMRANPADVNTGQYNKSKTCDVPTADSTLVENDLRIWMKALKDNLGNANTTCGQITCNAMNCTVTIFWNDGRGTNGSSSQQISVAARL